MIIFIKLVGRQLMPHIFELREHALDYIVGEYLERKSDYGTDEKNGEFYPGSIYYETPYKKINDSDLKEDLLKMGVLQFRSKKLSTLSVKTHNGKISQIYAK
ncbi:hypothetical protein [Xanthocytophaga flava]|uniref:hypothetical protein n=1 Tax=Xanthocytophaga flava TaxID=3048013 RepID=UPI0028D23FF1|nr:hypothetical protein [Xanthocytophaga flavus]MDJ1470264.1 hypothetical protein [Xanthocytophaga flavus]